VTQVFLPIFPLPNLVFFPHTLLPLHIFETRYRAMVTDCLARDKRLAVVGLKPGYEADYHGKPAVYPVAGAGEIVQWERLPTGRYNILLRGDCRIRIESELPTDTLYRMVRAVVLDDRPPPEGTAGLTPLVERVKASCLRLLTAAGRSSPALEKALRDARSAAVVTDQIASAVLPDARLRQELLETLDVQDRLERLGAALGRLLGELAGGREGGDDA
jgi:Lon protease-like protein